MPNKIVYEIHLIDDVSEKAKAAEGHVKTLEDHLKGLGKTANDAGKSLGKMFEIPSAGDFLKQSVDSYGSMERSLALIQNTLKNTGNAAGLSFDELKTGAEQFAASTIYSKNQVLEMQAKLVQFPNITKDVFTEAEEAVMDLATQSGKSLEETSEAVGKALSDPSAIDDMLEEYGVAFDKKQKQLIERFTKSGRLKEAQQAILKGISDKAGGSTQAASSTLSGQAEIMNHRVDAAKEGWGKVALEQLTMEKPAIDGLINESIELTNWLDKNKDSLHEVVDVLAKLGLGIIAVGKVAGSVSSVLKGFNFLKGLFGGGEAAAGAAEGTEALGAAEIGGAGIVGTGGTALGVAAVAGLGLGTYEVYQKYLSTLTNYFDGKGFKSNEDLELEASGDAWEKKYNAQEAKKEQVKGIEDLQRVTTNATTYNSIYKKFDEDFVLNPLPADVAKHYKTVYETISHDEINGKPTPLTKISPEQFAKYVASNPVLQKDIVNMSEFDRSEIYTILDGLTQPKSKEKTKSQSSVTKTLSQMQSSVTGQNIKNYNIKIGTLGQISMNVKTLVESKTDVKRVITDWLLDALHDSELTA